MKLFLRLWAAPALVALLAGSAQAQVLPGTPVSPASPTTPAAAPPAASILLGPTQVPGDYKTYLYQRYASDRRAAAVVRLFARRQTGGAFWLGSGAVFIGTLAAASGTHNSSSGGTYTLTVTPLGYALFIGLFGGVGIGKLSRFSSDKLFRTLRQYDQNGSLPDYVRSRLHEYD